jgi:hypothetical protein
MHHPDEVASKLLEMKKEQLRLVPDQIKRKAVAP